MSEFEALLSEVIDKPIVAAATPPFGNSPFGRGRPIVKMDDDLFVRTGIVLLGHLMGQSMTRMEYEVLVSAQHFTVLPTHCRLGRANDVWIFRKNFPRLEEALRSSRNVSSEPMDLPDGGKALIITSGREVLIEWRMRAMQEARRHASQGDWNAAETEALVALACDMTSDVLGFLCVVYERQGRIIRSDGMMTMALRSRGREFEAEVIRMRDNYRLFFGHQEGSRP